MTQAEKTPADILNAMLSGLRAQARRNREAGAAICEEIRILLALHSESFRLTARQIQPQLSRNVSVRRIQEHTRKIKSAEPWVSRNVLVQSDTYGHSDRTPAAAVSKTRLQSGGVRSA